ncbi:unnamed protein product [Plutella xylostella]|uniref:(diamondback moth) hypothetical protein n=1 Tax=Plutella xylostella TaxID=51655 RepID=A0A8S4D026_PLUXY|nr:unnamed protein product [Plutella xylostella]
MAEFVNQRIEDMINELEQMRRTGMYNDDEIREIARKRKEFEYKIQRRVKSKEDFVHYIEYELTMLEDISLRRRQANLSELKKDIEYAIAKRVNKVFKQFIYRFQNDIEIYFQYIKFCRGVGFESTISGIIGQMLQMYGDKPKMWQLASKWESEEQRNLPAARDFLLKGLHRHPDAEVLYLDLFKIELILANNSATDEDKEKQIKRASIVWRNCEKNITDVSVLFKLFDVCVLYDEGGSVLREIKEEIWSRNSQREVWCFIAAKELEGCHWDEIEEFVDEDSDYPDNLKYYMAVYEETLQRFPDESLCTKLIHNLLGASDSVCSGEQKVNAVKSAWLVGHEQGLLPDHMYPFGIQMLKLENELSSSELFEILDTATKRKPSAKCLWEEKLSLAKPDEKKMLSVVQEASRALAADDAALLWHWLLDHVETSATLKNVYKRVQNCESAVLLAVKSKLLVKMYEHCGLKATREMYEEFIRTPPIQLDLHTAMIDIESNQEVVNVKQIRKCYECLVQHHGRDNVDVWCDYMKFETSKGSAALSPAIYRRAVATLKKELVDQFIKNQALAKIKS